MFHYIRLEHFFNCLPLKAPDTVAFHILSVLLGSLCFSAFVVLFIFILQAIVSALLSSAILLFGPSSLSVFR
jgi:hypothetical protein